MDLRSGRLAQRDASTRRDAFFLSRSSRNGDLVLETDMWQTSQSTWKRGPSTRSALSLHGIWCSRAASRSSGGPRIRRLRGSLNYLHLLSVTVELSEDYPFLGHLAAAFDWSPRAMRPHE